jgi:hypothetical protein
MPREIQHPESLFNSLELEHLYGNTRAQIFVNISITPKILYECIKKNSRIVASRGILTVFDWLDSATLRVHLQRPPGVVQI